MKYIFHLFVSSNDLFGSNRTSNVNRIIQFFFWTFKQWEIGQTFEIAGYFMHLYVMNVFKLNM